VDGHQRPAARPRRQGRFRAPAHARRRLRRGGAPRGIGLGIVAGGAGCFVAHPLLDEPLLVDVARGGRVVEASGRTDDIGWQCSHQVAARILNRIGERAERTGNVAWALRAAELRLALPFTRPVLDDLRHALGHLRARMN
jgi:hypothetical protein